MNPGILQDFTFLGEVDSVLGGPNDKTINRNFYWKYIYLMGADWGGGAFPQNRPP